MTGWSKSERAQIARGEFFTEAELSAVPSRRYIGREASPSSPRRDPNDGPVSKATLDMLDGGECCAWCMEPEDDDQLTEASNGSRVHAGTCLAPMNDDATTRRTR